MYSPKIQPEDNLPTGTWSIEPVKINAINFKKTRMHFINNVSLRIKYLFVSSWCVSQELKEENKQMEVGMREILAQLKEHAQKGLLVLIGLRNLSNL